MRKILVMLLTSLLLLPLIGCEIDGVIITPGTGPDSSTPSDNGSQEIQFDDYPQKARELFEGLWAIDALVWIYHYIDKRNVGQFIDLQKIKSSAEGAIPQVEQIVNDHRDLKVAEKYRKSYMRILTIADRGPEALRELISAIDSNDKEQINYNLDLCGGQVSSGVVPGLSQAYPNLGHSCWLSGHISC
jgi:hypothetical protein